MSATSQRLPPDLGAQSRDERPARAAQQVLRFGLLTSGAPLTPWQQGVLEQLLRTPGVLADCWLLCAPKGLHAAVDPFAGRNDSNPALREPPVELRWKRDANASDVAAAFRAVQKRELDFILSFTAAADARFLLSATRWGVWQFFFGDWVRWRGESEGFWEIAEDVAVASALLVQLQPEVDSVRILKQGRVRSHPFRPARTVRCLRERCVHWPRQVCLELMEGVDDSLTGPLVRADARPRSRRSPLSRLRFALRGGWRVARDGLRQLFVHDQWTIGVIDAPIQSLLEGAPPLEPRWLLEPHRLEFFADPFGIVQDGRLTVFCEAMDYRTGVGSIVAFEESRPAQRVPVSIGPSVHRSYPYLLRENGRLYCIPETCATNDVALFECERFPDRWRRVATLVSGLPLIDATPFRYEGRWWLAASLPLSHGSNCELHLYYAESLEGPWRAHAANPVKIDVESARPGGTPFWSGGWLYRPAQDCSTTYGRRIAINRVLRLTETTFAEEVVTTVEPMRPYAAGLHTLSAAGNVTIVDAKRHVFVPQQARIVLSYAYRKFLKALRRNAPGRAPASSS